MRGYALFGDAVHLLGADLHFKALPRMNHRGVQGLVEVRAGHGDVVLEPPRDRPPNLMDHAERRITIANGVGNHPYGQQVVDLIDGAVLAQTFLVNGVEALHAPVHYGGNSVFIQALANGFLQFREKCLKFLALGHHRVLQLLVGFGLEVAEGDVFQLAANQAHP